MKQGLLSLLLFSCFGLFAQSDVTFSVDMNSYEDAFTVVHLSGAFNGWSGDANNMSDEDGDGIWTVTVQMPDGPNEFKFGVDNWNAAEAFTGSEDCTTGPGEFVNRIIEVNGATTAPTFCWNACVGCADVQFANVTLNLDMNEYASDFTTAYVSGAFNGWAGDANPMTDEDGDGVWTVTLALANGPQEYKFQLDAWAAQENFTEGAPCTITGGGFTNRLLEVTGDVNVPTVCYNSCEACNGSSAQDGAIVMSVDMNDYTGDFTTVYLSGTFNGWSPDANPMADEDGDGVWTTTVDMVAGPQEFKFQVDGWTDQEMFSGDEECTTGPGEFVNRIIEVDGDATLETVCWGACGACGGSTTEDGNITFAVDMNDYAAEFTTVYISGTFNGWSGDANPLADEDGDGVWTASIPLMAGAQEYKFQLDAWTVQEEFTGEEECTTPPAEFVNRIVEVNGDAALDAVCWNSCSACVDVPPAEGLSLSVDMNLYLADFTTVYVSGTFNGWSGDANPMADEDGDGVWTVNLPLEDGSYEYKFQVDAWTAQEEFEEGASCTVTAEGFTNRFVEVAGPTTVETVCWASCEACPPTLDGMVSFSVDMNEFAESFETVYIGGTFNGWSGEANPMTDDDGDGVWVGTVMMPAGDNEYKFLVDNWTFSDQFEGGEDCTVTDGEFTNRYIFVNGDASVDTVCFSSCSPCGVVEPQEGNITLSVDMNEYTGAFTTVYVSGAFNGWAGDVNPMADEDGDGVWTVTVTMPGGAQEYKFQVDEWTDQEMLAVGSECTLTTGEFTNRIIEVDGDAEIATVCWGSCEACNGTGGPEPGNITLRVNMNDYATDNTFTQVFLGGTFNGWAGDANEMTDADADGVYEITVEMPAGANEFKFLVDNWADSEQFTGDEECTTPPGEFVNRIIQVDGDADYAAVCWASCTDCTVNTNELVDSDLIFTLQPTLAQNFTTVIFNENITSATEIQVSDALGRIIYTGESPAFTLNHRINTEAFGAGTYFVLVSTENKTAVSRFMVTK